MTSEELSALVEVRDAYWRQPWHDEVLALCERHGFGAVMQSASEQWRKRDPIGALSVGECFGSLKPSPNETGAAS